MALPKKVYLKLTLDISRALETEEQEDIKYLSRAILPKDVLKRIKNFRELASGWDDEAVINENKLGELVRLLGEIERHDLVKMVEETKAQYIDSAQGQPTQSSSCSPGPSSSMSAHQTHHISPDALLFSNTTGLVRYSPVPRSNTAGSLESSNLEIDSSDVGIDGAVTTQVDFKVLTSKATTLKPYQEEVAERALHQNSIIHLPVNGERERVAVYIWKKLVSDVPQTESFQTLILVPKVQKKSFEAIFKSEAGDNVLQCVHILTSDSPEIEDVVFEFYHLIIIDESDTVAYEIDHFNKFLKNCVNMMKVQPRLLGFTSSAGISGVEQVARLCQLFSASVVSYVVFNISDMTNYCHPPEEDNFVFVSQKSNQSANNNMHRKLISRLKTEFCRDPLRKGIIVTKTDEETNKVFQVVNNEFCTPKFKVRPQKLLSSFNHNRDILVHFNNGNCNVLIATDAMYDDIELEKCQFLVRYNLVEKKMGTIQTLARSRETCSKCYLIIYEHSQEHKRENEHREQRKALHGAFESFNNLKRC